MSRFETEFVKPFNREIVRVKDLSANAVADTAEEVFGSILALWPKDTFWSDANHRINIGINPARDFPVEPPQRPAEAGALTGESSANENEQIAKLDGVGFGDSVLIGNAVNYAANVAFKPGNGTRIYHEAGVQGSALVASRSR
jgi:hypothetical protein